MTDMYAQSQGVEVVEVFLGHADPTLHELGSTLEQAIIILQSQGKIPPLFHLETVHGHPVLGRRADRRRVTGRGDDGQKVAMSALASYRAYMRFASKEMALMLWSPEMEVPLPTSEAVDKLAGAATRRIHRFMRVLDESDLRSGTYRLG